MRAIVFTVLAFGASWAVWFGLSPGLEGPALTGLKMLYMFGPLVAALATRALFDRSSDAKLLAVRWRPNVWWLIAWLAAPLLAFAALGVTLAFPGTELRSFDAGAAAMLEQAGAAVPEDLAAQTPPFAVMLGVAMLGGVFPNAIAAFGEEAGWRGYLWSVLRPGGFWTANLLVGLVWGLWHAPLIMHGHNYGLDYPGAPWTGVAMMTAFCVALSPLLGLLRDRAGSVIAPSIAHGTVNAVAGLAAVVVGGAPALVGGLTGLAGLAVLAVATMIVALLRPNRPPAG